MSDIRYRPRGAKPHFDAEAYQTDMPSGGPTRLALTTVAFSETELLAAARARTRS